MKKFFGILGIAILGGVISLGGYKLLLKESAVFKEVNSLDTTQTYRTNFTTSFDVNNSGLAPTSFTDASEKTIHAVVHVKNRSIKSGTYSWADIFSSRKQYEQVGTGSGVIISSDGYIVTNNHVIDEASSIEITLNNKRKYEAELIGTDVKNDIALLKIDADEELPYIVFADSDNVKIGEWVLAVGNPYNLTSTVTAGIVSAKGRDLEGNGGVTDSFIQTDAAVNPGNSGGALVNIRGELVGINTAISSKTGAYVGYSFAVPSNIAKKIVDDILEFGIVQEAVLGIMYDPSDKETEGVRITDLPEDGGAKEAGLQNGDVIKKVNNVKISKFSELSGQLTAKRPGEYVSLTVDRDGTFLTKKVKLGKKDTYISRILGLQLKDVSKRELEKYDLDGGAKLTASNNETFNYSGIRVGSIITSINKKRVSGASEAISLLEDAYKRRIRIGVEIINVDGEVERYIFN